MKKILLISPFPPTQNPRLVKEYEILKQKGFKVKVLYAERDKWASAYNIPQNEDFIRVGGSYGSTFYYLTRLLHKLTRKVLPLEFGYHRVSLFLYIKALTIKSDLYIAHNLAALPIAVKIAKFHRAKSGFDAEDFHRYETTNDDTKTEFLIPKKLEDKYIEQTNYLTTASPLISDAYHSAYPLLQPITINNVFQIKYLKPKGDRFNTSKYLRLFWFSQTIGRERGIEAILSAIGLLQNKNIKLTLLGSVSEADKTYFENLALTSKINKDCLTFLSTVSPEKIFDIAKQYDIGLALEQNTPLNRDLCLTNKIFTYLTSGLAIIASETKSQYDFMKKYPLIGISYPIEDIEALAKAMDIYDKNRSLLNKAKSHSYQLAEYELNWEKESIKFMQIIEKVLNY